MGLVGRVGRVGLAGLTGLAVVAGCSRNTAMLVSGNTSAPPDAQHQGITTPHGDHSPHHGGMVLMNGELHYEVVFDRGGRHRIWFSDAVRQDLPASIAREVVLIVARPRDAPERLALEIDEAGESWVARGRPVEGNQVMTKLTYTVQGRPYEIEIPFVVGS